MTYGLAAGTWVYVRREQIAPSSSAPSDAAGKVEAACCRR